MPRGHKTIILSDEQRKIAEENHNLIYWFAKKYHVPIEEYYDVLAQGLCMAAYHYDPSKCSFSTYAYLCMNTEMHVEYRKTLRKSEIPQGNIFHYENAWQLSDLIPTNEKTENKVIDKISYENLISLLNDILNDKDKEVLTHIVNGLTMREIAKIEGTSHQAIHNRMKKIREKVKKSYE